MNKFQYAVQFLVDPKDGYDAEGGYVNDPRDPGGETNYGISKRAFPELDIKNLSLADAMVIYKRDYWDFYNLNVVDIPLCIVMLDGYVQHRPSVVRQMVKEAKGDWKRFIQKRVEFYLRLIQKKPEMRIYKRGWLNRMNSLSKYCQIVLDKELYAQ